MHTYIPPPYLPKTIVFVRHPECLHNASFERAFKQGIPNKLSPLTEFGMLQCEITAEYLKTKFGAFNAVYCSKYPRTHTIPESMGQSFNPQVYAELDECDGGIWHTMSRREIKKRYPTDILRHESESPYHYKARGGESCAEVEKRLIDFLSLTNELAGKQCILISGHGVSGLYLRRLLTGASVDTWNEWYKNGGRLKNASVTVFKRRGVFYTTPLYNHVPWAGKINSRHVPK